MGTRAFDSRRGRSSPKVLCFGESGKSSPRRSRDHPQIPGGRSLAASGAMQDYALHRRMPLTSCCGPGLHRAGGPRMATVVTRSQLPSLPFWAQTMARREHLLRTSTQLWWGPRPSISQPERIQALPYGARTTKRYKRALTCVPPPGRRTNRSINNTQVRYTCHSLVFSTLFTQADFSPTARGYGGVRDINNESRQIPPDPACCPAFSSSNFVDHRRNRR